MKAKYIWGSSSYVIYLKSGEELPYQRACFTAVRDYENPKQIDKILLKSIACKKTFKYQRFYLEYITDMLQLQDVKITDNSFLFKAYPNNRKNMLVLSIVRLLYEKFGCMHPALDMVEYFFEPLKNGKSKYRNKLARFCDFYSQIPVDNRYFSDGHSWEPKYTIIKYTKDFLKVKKLTSVNSFFYK